MKRYIGTKIINAKPMNRADYNEYRNWVLPANEDGADDGYLVEYLDGGKSNDSRHAGYISWSPKEQFEGAYRETSGLSFGLALEALKKGEKVSRAGWNGKDMWLSLSCNGNREVAAENFWSPHNAEITLKTTNAHGRVAILMGWLASQTDLLSEDWMVVAGAPLTRLSKPRSSPKV